MCHTYIVKMELTQTLGTGAFFAQKKKKHISAEFFKMKSMLIWLVNTIPYLMMLLLALTFPKGEVGG